MTPSRRTVLIAVDASPQSLEALETAATVAACLQAELRGMYVEDIDLVRTAELPFASAISSFGKSCALTPEIMESQFRRQAGKARDAVEAAGTRSRIAWSFSVVRGAVFREIERAASTADLVAVGRSGWSASTGRRLGSVTRALVETGATSLLMVADGGLRGPFAVLYDGSPSSERALALAIALDERSSHPITVSALGDSPSLTQKATELLKDAKTRLRFEHQPEDTSALFSRLKPPAIRTLLLPATLLANAAGLTTVLENNLSIFVVR